MLTKMVDGVEITCSPEEDENIRAYWALNIANPEYVGACAYDGVNPPYYLMDEAKNIHLNMIEVARQNALSAINATIETAQEDGLECSSCFAQRKDIKAASVDLSKINDIEGLKNSVPDLLLVEFNKLTQR